MTGGRQVPGSAADKESDSASGIIVERLTKTYGGHKTPALSDFSLKIEAGEFFGLIGPNGAGKTTLMSCLLGLQTPSSGKILVNGRLCDTLGVRRISGYLPERLNFEPWMYGREFLEYQHELSARPSGERKQEVTFWLSQVGLESAAWNQKLNRYSRGMLQRLGLAQAMIGRPKYIFLDEPTSGIDPSGTLFFINLFQSLRDRGVTVILNSHQLDQVERLCDRVAFIRHGKLVSIEDLRSTAQQPLFIRWIPQSNAEIDGQLLADIAARAGCLLLSAEGCTAKFTVNGDAGTAQLVSGLTAAGQPPVEVRADRRLEQLFLQTLQEDGVE